MLRTTPNSSLGHVAQSASPDVETPEYNTVDATLWYFIAGREYVGATGDNVAAARVVPHPG